MRNFFEKIVNNRKVIIAAFAICFIVCIFFMQQVKVNYDMNDYLPKDSLSTISLEVMETEYGGGIPNARVLINNVTVPIALEYKDKLLQIDGVTDVTWLDDEFDLLKPLESYDSDVIENYYKDDIALFNVTILDDKRVEAVADIRNLIGDENSMTGSAVSTAIATTKTVGEIAIISIVAVIFVLIVLTLTTTSWLEPLIIFCGLGVAIIINSGTNLIFGEISFVTNAAGNILQLAVSLDYSVFLLHRFIECRENNSNDKEAMVEALCKSVSSILSSGLTTVIGFLALCLMQFGIGPDLGLALAKGITISLVTVFVFTPALILCSYKLIDKTQHRPFLPKFNKFGRLVSKLMIPMVCVFVIICVPSYLASINNNYYYGASRIFNEQTQLGADTAKIEKVFGKNDTYVLLVPKSNLTTEAELSYKIKKVPQVSSVISYVDLVGPEIPKEYLDSDALSKLISDNYSRMIISVDADFEGEETFLLIDEIKNIANEFYPNSYYLAGEGISTYDLKNTVTGDMVKVNLIAIGSVFIVLLLTMKNIFLPIILVLSIEVAIWINLSVPYFADSYIFYIAYLIISSVQLGATVDYAILFTDRYREFCNEMDKKEAIINTVSVTTVSILTSGATLVTVGLLLGKFSTHGLLSQLGYLLGKGTLCSLVIVLFVLPGLLYIFDRFFVKDKRKAKSN